MFKTMLRDLLAHKGRVLMTLVAIALGVTATVGSWVVSDSIAATLTLRETRDDVSVAVQSPGKEPVLGATERDRLAVLPGVAAAEGVVVGRAGLVGPDGKLVKSTTVLDRAGTNWSNDERFSLDSGRKPRGTGEVALNSADAETAGVGVGDTVRVLLMRRTLRTGRGVGPVHLPPAGPAGGGRLRRGVGRRPRRRLRRQPAPPASSAPATTVSS